MQLSIREISAGPGEDFNVPDGYKFRDHWVPTAYRGQDGHRQFAVVDEGDVEVARIDLRETATREGFREATYPISEDGLPILEIQFIDVREPYRVQGIGTWIVRYLEREHPGRQLVALPEKSEGFWEKLGWERLLPEDPLKAELYVST